MAKFVPQTTLNPEPIVTKFETRDYGADIYHHKKLGVNPPKGFLPPTYVKYTPKTFECLLLFLLVLQKVYIALVGPIFTFNTSYDVVLRKVVPSGVRKINFKI